MSDVKHNLTDRELATVLHSLRCLQELREPLRPEDPGCLKAEAQETPCDHFEGTSPLSNVQIDKLCERLNLATEEAIAERSWKLAAAVALKEMFPWLGANEENVNMRFLISDLDRLYCKWNENQNATDGSLVVLLTKDQRDLLSGVLDSAVEEIRGCMRDPEVIDNHGEDWPGEALREAARCRAMATLADEQLRINGELERWTGLAEEWDAVAHQAEQTAKRLSKQD